MADKNDKKPPYDYDGVVYEPSNRSQDRNQARRGTTPPASRRTSRPPSPASRPSSHTTAKPRHKKQQRSQFALFYIVTLFTGVIICIIIFAVVFSSISSKSRSENALSSIRGTSSPEPTEIAIKEMNQVTGVITHVNSDSRTIEIIDVESNLSLRLIVEANSNLKDKYGQIIVFGELNTGMVVETGFDAKTNKVTNLSISSNPSAWDIKAAKDVQINTDNKTITIGNAVYTYDDSLMVYYGGQPYDVNKLTTKDVLTVSGYKNKAWYIQLLKSHGSVRLINMDKIKDGVLEIDTDVYLPFNPETDYPIEMLEGSHRIVIKGSNIEPFTKEVNITSGETLDLDLKDIQYKSGMLHVVVNETDYVLTVNNEALPTTEPLVLEYGEYTFRVEKDDFLPWEEKLTVNEPTMEIKVELKKEVKMSKVEVVTFPEGATVYIDNTVVGVSPVSTQVEYGDHAIVVRKEGYTETSVPASITKPAYLYEITLQKKDIQLPSSSWDTATPAPTAPLPGEETTPLE